jgi:hypothetical protein
VSTCRSFVKGRRRAFGGEMRFTGRAWGIGTGFAIGTGV